MTTKLGDTFAGIVPPLEKLNVSIGQICDIIGLREIAAFPKVTAFIKNYESESEYTGTLTITNQTDINAEYTPILPLTASLLHQNAGVGRVCGVVEVISTPIMALTNSYVPGHEDEQIPNLTFDVKLDNNTTTGAFIWGDHATSLFEQSIAIHTRLLLIRAFAKANGDGLSLSPKSAPDKQPTIIILSPQQSAAQYAAMIERIETLPDASAMKAARYQALQKRITALQAELTAIINKMHLFISD